MTRAPEDGIRIQLLQALLDRSVEGIVFVDPSGEPRLWNQAAESLLGIRDEELFNGELCQRLIELSGKHRSSLRLDPVDPDSAQAAPSEDRGADDWANLQCSVDTIEVDGATWQMICLHRGQLSQRDQQRLYEQAYTDELSQLLNRRGFQANLESNLDRRLALAIVDIDHFKRINDRCGHSTGDQAIVWLASRLKDAFPDAVSIGRLGGDEFGVVMALEAGDPIDSRFESFCADVRKQEIGWCPPGISVSVGVAIALAECVSARELLTQADWAMYQSKTNGRDRCTSIDVSR